MAGRYTVGYATDVEGNIDFWERYIDRSEVLHRDRSTGELILHDQCCFVYGGDTCDRGSGDLQVLTELVSLKESHPDRVFLLMGNRDINKLRFPVATQEQVLSLRPECYFAAKAANVDGIQDYKYHDVVSKVKWVLLHTMGSPFAFEYRRIELQQSGLPSSDTDVANSFIDITRPAQNGSAEGIMLRYLTLAQVAVILGDVMYVHGAIHDFNMGFVPYRRDSAEMCALGGSTGVVAAKGYVVEDPHEWCDRINAFAAAEVRDFRENIHRYLEGLGVEIARRQQLVLATLGIPDLATAAATYSPRQLADLYASTEYTDPATGQSCRGIGGELLLDELSGYLHPQPGSGLVTYGMGHMRGQAPTRSAIYASYLSAGEPTPCTPSVAQWLRGERSGRPVRTIVVGHQPHADAPFTQIIDGLQVISTDSSYSINTQWPRTHLAKILCGGEEEAAAVSRDDTVAYVSCTQYLREQPSAATVFSHSTTNSVNHSAGAIPDSAVTRSPLCVAELLFDFPTFPADPLADEVACRGLGRMQGELSDGSTYSCALPTPASLCKSGPEDGASQERGGQEEHLSELIGRQTKGGWFIKAVGVQTVQDGRSTGAEKYVLLAQSSGYDFRNRLVRVADIETLEFC